MAKKSRARAKRRSEQLVEEFSEAAQYWGWQRDMGYGPSVEEAEADYLNAKPQLLDHINRLHNKVNSAETGERLARRELNLHV